MNWIHCPPHVFVPGAAYMITAGTVHKEHFFRGPDRVTILGCELLDATADYGWALQAWALFANHYHVVALAPYDGASLGRLIQRLHSATARAVNGLDRTPGRRVWFQYWDTCLTYESSYYARVNYVHHNAVHHGLANAAEAYEFCSAAWFRATAERSLVRRVESHGYDRVTVIDDF